MTKTRLFPVDLPASIRSTALLMSPVFSSHVCQTVLPIICLSGLRCWMTMGGCFFIFSSGREDTAFSSIVRHSTPRNWSNIFVPNVHQRGLRSRSMMIWPFIIGPIAVMVPLLIRATGHSGKDGYRRPARTMRAPTNVGRLAACRSELLKGVLNWASANCLGCNVMPSN